MAGKTQVPLTSWKAILARSGGREPTEREWRDFLAEHGRHIQPPGDEGKHPELRSSGQRAILSK